MSSQATTDENPTTPRDQGTQASQVTHGSISGPEARQKDRDKKASQIKHTGSVIQTPPEHILRAAHEKKWSKISGGKKTKRKKRHRRKKGGHCSKNINKINRLIKTLKKEMKKLERKQKSYYTKSKKIKKSANKKHIKTFKKLKLKLNKI